MPNAQWLEVFLVHGAGEPFIRTDELFSRGDLPLGQTDKRVHGKEMGLVGFGRLVIDIAGIDHYTRRLGRRRTQHQSDVRSIQQRANLLQRGTPRRRLGDTVIDRGQDMIELRWTQRIICIGKRHRFGCDISCR